MKTLTPKEKKAIANLKSGKSKRQSIMEAYDCKNLMTADKIGQKVFKKEKVVKELQLWRDREREELLPLAYQKRKDILSSNISKKVSDDVIRKTAKEVFDESLSTKDTERTAIITLTNKFWDTNRAKELKIETKHHIDIDDNNTIEE